MTPDELKAIRRQLGLSAQGLADALGVISGRTVRKWEHGDQDISPQTAILLRIWADPRCPDWAKPWLVKDQAA